MIELKFCPLCGKAPRIVENKINLKSIMYGVYCSDEHHEVSVGYFYTEEEAIEAWEMRVNNKGKWLTYEDDVYWGNSIKRKYCSACGKKPHFDRETGKYILTDFCHNCGADMRG